MPKVMNGVLRTATACVAVIVWTGILYSVFGVQSIRAAGSDSVLINPESDLTYLGAFLLPEETSSETSWSYGGDGMTFRSGGDPSGPADGYPGSLISISHPYQNLVSEFTIPEPVISADHNEEDLNRAATIQPFTDVTAGRQTGGLTGLTLADIQYFPPQGKQTTDKLYWVMYEYYMPQAGQPGHGWCELDFTELRSAGMWRLGDFPFSATSRYLFDIPTGWTAAYTPGKYLAGGRSRLVNGGSWGPALYAFGPYNDGDPPADGSALSAVELLKYSSEHLMCNYSHVDGWNDGAWLTVGSKAAVMVAGTKGYRTKASGLEYYGGPTVDGCGSKGYHAEPYYGCVLFYDPEMIAAVAQGSIEAHAVQPYAFFNVEDILFKQGCRRSILGGVGYDRTSQLLYIMEKLVEGFYARKPIVHVFRLQDAGKTADRTPPSTPSGLTGGKVTAGSVTFTWQPSTDDTRVVGYVVFRNGDPIATTRETRYTDANVNPEADYAYTVQAWDARDLRSGISSPLAASPPPGPDTLEPMVFRITVHQISDSGATISWRTDEPATTRMSYGIQYGGDTQEHLNATLKTDHTVVLQGLEAGTAYTYAISAADAQGNAIEMASKLFITSSAGQTEDATPVLNGIGCRRVGVGEAIRITLAGDDSDGDPLTYSAAPLPQGATFDAQQKQFSWTPTGSSVGSHTVTFTVSDGDQSDEETVTLFVVEKPVNPSDPTPEPPPADQDQAPGQGGGSDGGGGCFAGAMQP